MSNALKIIPPRGTRCAVSNRGIEPDDAALHAVLRIIIWRFELL